MVGNLTILAMIESTTGLANAVLMHRKGDATHQRQQIEMWIATNRFATSILQTDGKSALTQLGDTTARELGLRYRLLHPTAINPMQL